VEPIEGGRAVRKLDSNCNPLGIGNPRISGTVKWFDNARGYGFIAPDGGGKDIFVHHTAIDMDGYKTLKESQRVTFAVVRGGKGPQADEVSVI
jgi:cold shock protein